MQWPADTMAAKVAFYGDPRGPHGVNEKWFDANMARIVPPWQMQYAGKPIKTITFHKKCSDALLAALNEIWLACGKDQKTIEKYGLHEFGGTFNYRLIRGSNALSNHSFGIAIDIAPTGNPLGSRTARWPAFAVQAFKKQGARYGGDYSGRKDPMHAEFVSPA